MPIYPYKDVMPQIGRECYIAPSADVVGSAFIGDKCSIWFQTVLRADVNEVHIGENSNVQDLCCLHVSHEQSLVIGKNVTVGHQVTLHGCRVGDHCLIGMRAVIMDGVEIGENSLVAAGALIPPGKKYPPYSYIVGSPATLKRQLTPEEREEYAKFYLHYQPLREDFRRENHSGCLI